MTTVAYSNGQLAAETLYVSGTRKMQGDYCKIHTPDEGETWTVEGQKILAFGFSGGVGVIHLIKKALTEGLVHGVEVDTGDNGFGILLVTDTKVTYVWSHGKNAKNEVVNDLYVVEGNHAIGSGAPYALGVMAIKGTAADGVAGAIKVDIHSGGFIDVWSFDDPKKIQRINPNPLTPEQVEQHQLDGDTILCVPGVS